MTEPMFCSLLETFAATKYLFITPQRCEDAPTNSYSRSFMISATKLSGSMMALRETPLMTDSLVRTLMALEEG